MRVERTFDPLSSAFNAMKLRASLSAALDAGGEWGVEFPGYEGFTLNVVQRGECWLEVAGQQPLRLRSGDCFLLTGSKAFTLASDLRPRRRDRAEDLYIHARDGVALCNGGGDFFVVGTIFRFHGHLPSILFNRLPPVIYISGDSSDAAAFRWSFDRFGSELRSMGVGYSMMLGHLAPVMLLQMLRMYLSSSPAEQNWLRALAEPRLLPVLEAMQTNFARAWTLSELAGVAQMSRSGFALTFKNIVGVPPLLYLANWRMQIACELLEGNDKSLADIATMVGYDSESAFSNAFLKVVKCRPGQYRSRRPRPNTAL